jgi:hypothetical protein
MYLPSSSYSIKEMQGAPLVGWRVLVLSLCSLIFFFRAVLFRAMLITSASAKNRQGSRKHRFRKIGEKIGKNRQTAANIKKYKIYSFFSKF